MKRMIPLGVTLILAAATASAQDFDKSKHPWARYKAGTSVSYILTMDMGPMGAHTGTITQILKEVTNKNFTRTIRNAVTMMGQEQVQEEEESEAFPVRTGEETLTVDGKEYPCVTWKASGKKRGQDTEACFWITEDGSKLLKVSEKRQDQEFSVTAVKLSDETETGGKKYDCVRLEGKMTNPTGESVITIWSDWDGLPSGFVKVSMKDEKNSTEVTFTLSEVKIAE